MPAEGGFGLGDGLFELMDPPAGGTFGGGIELALLGVGCLGLELHRCSLRCHGCGCAGLHGVRRT